MKSELIEILKKYRKGEIYIHSVLSAIDVYSAALLQQTPAVRSFYVLTHCGQFIDERLLQKGLYATSVPKLYSKETTIDLMMQQGRIVTDMTGNQFIEESYFENLSKCKLTEVQLSVFE